MMKELIKRLKENGGKNISSVRFLMIKNNENYGNHLYHKNVSRQLQKIDWTI